jgi:hypothetical protein
MNGGGMTSVVTPSGMQEMSHQKHQEFIKGRHERLGIKREYRSD